MRKSTKALTEALALIETEGWTKYTKLEVSGSFCILGAVAQVTTGTPYGDNKLTGKCIKRLAYALPTEYNGTGAFRIAIFNDSMDTHKADVVALFKRAIRGQKSSAK